MGQMWEGRRLAVLRRNVAPLEPLRVAHEPFSAPSSGQEEWLIRCCRLASLFGYVQALSRDLPWSETTLY